MKFRMLVEQDEDGMHVADCPDVFLMGKTREEAIANIKDAIKGYMES